jgi:hypothetical protein
MILRVVKKNLWRNGGGGSEKIRALNVKPDGKEEMAGKENNT